MKSIEERLIEYHGAHMAAENEVLGFPKVPVLLRVVSNEIRRLRGSYEILRREHEELKAKVNGKPEAVPGQVDSRPDC
jgi:hypothetical protein